MRLVVKVGSSTLSHATGKINLRLIDGLCRVLSDLKNAGNEVILVSSGAIAMGVSKLSLERRPSDIPTKQAAAAVGQCELMYTYDKFFGEYNQTVAQILLTAEDVESAERRTHFENTLERLLQLGAVPVINENDTIATKEIAVGDNDTLAAIVAVSVGADLLVLLTDIDGLYTGDPRRDEGARLIPVVEELTPELFAAAGGSGTSLGTGGMCTKLQAAQMCMQSGMDMVIAKGSDPAVLYEITEGKGAGTRFKGKKNDDARNIVAGKRRQGAGRISYYAEEERSSFVYGGRDSFTHGRNSRRKRRRFKWGRGQDIGSDARQVAPYRGAHRGNGRRYTPGCRFARPRRQGA